MDGWILVLDSGDGSECVEQTFSEMEFDHDKVWF